MHSAIFCIRRLLCDVCQLLLLLFFDRDRVSLSIRCWYLFKKRFYCDEYSANFEVRKKLKKKIKERRIKVFWFSQSCEFVSILFKVSASDLSEQKSLVSPLKSKGIDETASIYRWQSRLDWICIATSYDADDDDADRKQTFSTPAPGVFFFYFLVKYSVNSLH